MLRHFLFFLIIFSSFVFISSCSFFSGFSGFSRNQHAEIKKEKTKFSYSDNTGNYFLLREVGVLPKKNEIFVKSQLLSQEGAEDQALEKIVNISEMGKLKVKDGEIKVIYPKVSQYTAWFEGEKFFSEIRIDVKLKKANITTQSPEKKWKGKSFVELPETNGIVCFFSQLIECIKVTNFIHLSIINKTGKMAFTVIWDKYPFVQEQYANIPSTLFSSGLFTYDGESEGFHKFVLKIEGQSIFYHFDKKENFSKIFWVVQGISQVKSTDDY